MKFNPIMAELEKSVKDMKSNERKEEERELVVSKQRQHKMETELERAKCKF